MDSSHLPVGKPDDALFYVDVFDRHLRDHFEKSMEKEVLDTQILEEGTFPIDLVELGPQPIDEDVSIPEEFEVLEVGERTPPQPFVMDPPSIELKKLPSHLEYAFLGDDSKLPVIIASGLSADEKSRLM
ncbi:hypothetical protein Tco_0569997 [Tanacetum coccineum]